MYAFHLFISFNFSFNKTDSHEYRFCMKQGCNSLSVVYVNLLMKLKGI